MTGAAIIDGDVVVVRQQSVAENGEIVAAQLDRDGTAEATVKTLQRLDSHVWLMPNNPAFQPIPADGAIILGRVVAVVRPAQAGHASAQLPHIYRFGISKYRRERINCQRETVSSTRRLPTICVSSSSSRTGG